MLFGQQTVNMAALLGYNQAVGDCCSGVVCSCSNSLVSSILPTAVCLHGCSTYLF